MSSRSSLHKYRRYRAPTTERDISDPHHENNCRNGSSKESDDVLQKRKLRFQSVPQKQEYGFASRGETKLQGSESARQKYFEEIVLSFFKLCDFATKSDLCRRLDVAHAETTNGNMTIDGVLTSLRKLREAMLGHRPTEFSKIVLLFSVRVAAPIGHYQTYLPSINQLLEPKVKLEPNERQELVVLLILHYAHFRSENSRALSLLIRGCPHDTRTHHLLRSWIQKDYYRWLSFYKTEEDNLRAELMKFGLPTMLQHMVSAISASYFNLPLSTLNEYLPPGVGVEDLKKYGAQWTIEGPTVVVRARKGTQKTQNAG